MTRYQFVGLSLMVLSAALTLAGLWLAWVTIWLLVTR